MGQMNGCLACFGANTNISNLATNVAQSINEKGCSDASSSAVVEQVSVNLTGVNCADIKSVVNSATSTLNCTMSATLTDYTDNIAKQIAGAMAKDAIQAKWSIGGVQFDTNIANIHTDVRQKLNQLCGNADAAASVVKGASFNFTNVKCTDLDVIMNKSNVSVMCQMHAAQNVTVNNKAVQGAGPSAVGSWSVWLIVGGCVIFIIIAAVVGHHLYRLKHPKKGNRKNVAKAMAKAKAAGKTPAAATAIVAKPVVAAPVMATPVTAAPVVSAGMGVGTSAPPAYSTVAPPAYSAVMPPAPAGAVAVGASTTL